MRYHDITKCDQNNGDGLRVVLWLSGCSHHCHNCQNQQTWNPSSGIVFDIEAEKELLEELNHPYISGITLSGGDPLHENNVKEVLILVNKIRILFPQKTIWLYTGYAYEQIFPKVPQHELTQEEITRQLIVERCNVLIDGRYEDSQRDVALMWRGSKNQRVINIKETLRKGEIVLWCQ